MFSLQGQKDLVSARGFGEKMTPDKAGVVCKWISQLNVDKTKNKIEEIFENCKKIKDKCKNAVFFNRF